MSILQKVATKNKDISGNPMQYYMYLITIPADIVEEMRLVEGQALFARTRKYSILLDTRPASKESIQITVRSKRTRWYKGQPYYTTQIVVPIEIIRELELKKGQELTFQTQDKTIVITQY